MTKGYRNSTGSDNQKKLAPFSIIPHDLSNFTTIDTAYYHVEYSLKFDTNPSNKDCKECIINDKHLLQIGKKTSKTFSTILFGTGLEKSKKTKANSAPMPPPVFPEIIYKKYPSNTYTGIYATALNSSLIKYEEEIPRFNWKITNERKTILSYSCKKATTTFRGRTYAAWYTEAIPLSNGPWKFNGLPGLILEVSDSKGDYFFSCTKVEKLEQGVPILFWKWDFKNTSREKMNKALKQIHIYPLRYFEKTGFYVSGLPDSVGIAYNPIELNNQ